MGVSRSLRGFLRKGSYKRLSGAGDLDGDSDSPSRDPVQVRKSCPDLRRPKGSSPHPMERDQSSYKECPELRGKTARLPVSLSSSSSLGFNAKKGLTAVHGPSRRSPNIIKSEKQQVKEGEIGRDCRSASRMPSTADLFPRKIPSKSLVTAATLYAAKKKYGQRQTNTPSNAMDEEPDYTVIPSVYSPSLTKSLSKIKQPENTDRKTSSPELNKTALVHFEGVGFQENGTLSETHTGKSIEAVEEERMGADTIRASHSRESVNMCESHVYSLHTSAPVERFPEKNLTGDNRVKEKQSSPNLIEEELPHGLGSRGTDCSQVSRAVLPSDSEQILRPASNMGCIASNHQVPAFCDIEAPSEKPVQSTSIPQNLSEARYRSGQIWKSPESSHAIPASNFAEGNHSSEFSNSVNHASPRKRSTLFWRDEPCKLEKLHSVSIVDIISHVVEHAIQLPLSREASKLFSQDNFNPELVFELIEEVRRTVGNVQDIGEALGTFFQHGVEEFFQSLPFSCRSADMARLRRVRKLFSRILLELPRHARWTAGYAEVLLAYGKVLFWTAKLNIEEAGNGITAPVLDTLRHASYFLSTAFASFWALFDPMAPEKSLEARLANIQVCLGDIAVIQHHTQDAVMYYSDAARLLNGRKKHAFVENRLLTLKLWEGVGGDALLSTALCRGAGSVFSI